jgi:hypothetical protein
MTTRSDGVVTSWLFSEYVYDPDGNFVGILQQRRRLEAQANGATRIYQSCVPRLKSDAHPLRALEGEWIYDITREGRIRRHVGPDVVGTGLKWGPDALTLRGVWPRFGHNFTQFSIHIAPNRQVTGGKVFNAGECIANLIGIGVPEVIGTESPYPTFTNPMLPQEIALTWSGTALIFDPGYRVQAEYNVIRQFTPLGWRDQLEGGKPTVINLEDMGQRWRITGSGEGVVKRYGWGLEATRYFTPSPQIERSAMGELWQYETSEVLDATSKTLISMTYSYTDSVFAQVSITKLKPNTIV